MTRLPHITTVLAVVAITSSSIVKSPTDGENFELLILHNNDMHARFEQTSQLSGACTTADREAGKCYGGFPRVAHVVKEARKAAASGEGPPVLYLNAGDTYTGTAWFTVYKWKVAAEFLNALQPDAVSLGNHEFDEEVQGVIPFIRNLSCPIVTANLILNRVPELVNIPNLHNSIVIVKNGVQIGIIGYLTPETKFLAPKNNVEYEDEILALSREVKKLKNLGIHILIALGHSGFLKDLEIAEKVDEIDLVIGGHSNTFLLNSNSTDEIPEYPTGPYPTLVQQKSGRKVPVVQAYAYTKYLGKLHLVFNDEGEIIRYDGYPILLNKDVPEDPEVLEIVKRYQKDIDRINDEVVGTSLVFLDGDSCRLRECNMGNFINDAIVDYTKKYFKNSPHFYIAITQGGRIRTSVNRPEKPFNITRGDIITVMPYSDTLCVLTMNGTVLRQALEHSVKAWRTIDTPGQFLQYSGVKVVYDLAQKAGSRIVKAAAICSECSELIDLQDNYEYKVITSIFIADGGDGYTMFETLPRDVVPYNEVDCAIDYLANHSPINTALSNRTIILNEDKVVTVPNAHIISTPLNAAVAVQLNTKIYYLLSVVIFIHYIY